MVGSVKSTMSPHGINTVICSGRQLLRNTPLSFHCVTRTKDTAPILQMWNVFCDYHEVDLASNADCLSLASQVSCIKPVLKVANHAHEPVGDNSIRQAECCHAIRNDLCHQATLISEVASLDVRDIIPRGLLSHPDSPEALRDGTI